MRNFAELEVHNESALIEGIDRSPGGRPITVRGSIKFDASEMVNLTNIILPKHTASILLSNVIA